MDHSYDENNTHCANGYGDHQDGDIVSRAHEAERAVMEVVKEELLASLHGDSEKWSAIDGFMNRIVKLLSILEDVHESSRHHHQSSGLEDLQGKTGHNDDAWNGEGDGDGDGEGGWHDSQYYDNNDYYGDDNSY